MAIKIFENENIGKIPPTPINGIVDLETVKQATDTLLRHAKDFGLPVAYRQEQSGRLIHNLIPEKKFENDQISGSSKVQLEYHTESAFHPYKPEHVHLLCLRGDENAATTYADLGDIMEELSPLSIETLQMPWFETGIDQSFRTNKQNNNPQIITPLRKTYNGWELCYDGELTKPTNTDSEQSLLALRHAILKTAKRVTLKSRQILTLDNKTTVHGRTPFKARYDGTDRWLQRVLTIKQMPPRSHMDGHIITTQFN